MMKSIIFNIMEKINVLLKSEKGWSKELNLISLHGSEPKYDVRDWSLDRQKMSKGTSLSREELIVLKELLKNIDL